MDTRRLATLLAASAILATGCGSSDDNSTADDTGTSSEGGVDSTTDSAKDSSSDSGADTPKDTTTTTDSTTTDAPTDADAGPPPTRTTSTNGSAIAITKDDKIAVAANRTAGTISVFALKFGDATAPIAKTTTLAVGNEPWSVVIGNDDDTAFVILRKDQKVVKVTGLHGTPAVSATSAATGSEPTGIAISPTGAKLFVANWAEGTVSVVATADMSIGTPIDLNAALVATGFLGASAVARPALAHPRSLVITNNGDTSDLDESMYVTEFYSQAATTTATDDSQFDLDRQGVVYKVKLSDVSVTAITLGAVASTGFADSNGSDTGCFPNQLYAAALNSGRLYVTSNCESPRGPTGPITTVTPTDTRNFKTEVHAAVFVIDTASDAEVPAQAVLLTKAFQALYDGATVADDGTRRIPLIANDLAFATGTTVAYVTGYGSDGVFRVQYNADGTLNRVGSTTQNFINLAPGGTTPGDGNLPVGIGMPAEPASAVAFSLVVNENSRNVSLVDLSSQLVIKAEPSDVAPPDPDPTKPGAYDKNANKGRKFFVTGKGRWSLKGQGWNSCESCHPDALTDNVTWYFARGPRQTVSLDGVYDPTKTKRRLLNWTAIFDEVHDFEGNVRGNSGGVGALVWQVSAPPAAGDRLDFDGTSPTPAGNLTTTNRDDALNGSTVGLVHSPPPTTLCTTSPCDTAAVDDWNMIDAFIKSVRSPRHPATLDAVAVAAGKTLFENNDCASCHGGSQWTISRVFWAPGEPTNTNLFTGTYALPTGFPAALNPPLLASGAAKSAVLRKAPFDAANDQINCILRDVGTFPGSGTVGVSPTGVTVKEVRQNMTTTAQGATGFNPPSLLNVVAGAPYFHAGNARTLEEVFDTTFVKHTQALASVFTPTATDIKNLVAFLSSIDNDATAEPIPSAGFNPDLCPATFP